MSTLSVSWSGLCGDVMSVTTSLFEKTQKVSCLMTSWWHHDDIMTFSLSAQLNDVSDIQLLAAVGLMSRGSWRQHANHSDGGRDDRPEDSVQKNRFCLSQRRVRSTDCSIMLWSLCYVLFHPETSWGRTRLTCRETKWWRKYSHDLLQYKYYYL